MIFIENCGPNKFAQVAAILGILYWKHCQLTKNNETPEIEAFLDSKVKSKIMIIYAKKYSVQFDQ